MRRVIRKPTTVAVIALSLVLVACGGGSGDETVADTTGDRDATTDNIADAAPETETVPDTAADTGAETTAEGDTDAVTRPDTGTDTDTAADTIFDTLPDTAPDAATDTATDTDTVPDIATDTGADTAADTGADTDTDSEAGADTAHTCQTAADCAPCELCIAGGCVPPAEPACAADADCPADWRCAVHETDPCRSRCTPPPECEVDGDCGACQGCVEGDCAVVTPAPCLVDTDCAAHERCDVQPDAPCENACVFVPECAVDGDCGPCEGCVDGLCVVVAPPPCTADADCDADEVCVIDSAAPCENACAPAPECTTDGDCGPCEGCVEGACATTTPAPCLADGDCAEAERCEIDAAAPCHNRCAPDPTHPANVFGAKYWYVYRPHFFANYYEDGRVCDRTEGGREMFGDNTLFMGYALTAFVHEYRAWPNADTLRVLHEILQAYEELEVLDGDPYDGYMVRSDRGPDYENNWFTRDNEPSGDQYLSTLRGLWDVVTYPGPLVHAGVDLKELARNRAAWLVYRLKANDWRLKNQVGQIVKRGDDQRWVSWAFQRGAGAISGLGAGVFESSWTVNVLGVPVSVGPSYQRGIARQFIAGCFAFTRTCVSGRSIDLGLGFSVDVDCNEFNIGLGGDAATIALSADPSSPDWFSAVVARDDIVAEGNAMWAMVARYRFQDDAPALHDVAANCFTAPAAPPRGDNLDSNGWCHSWRWAHDFATPGVCADEPAPFQAYSGLDYLLCRAMASAHGEFLPAADWE